MLLIFKCATKVLCKLFSRSSKMELFWGFRGTPLPYNSFAMSLPSIDDLTVSSFACVSLQTKGFHVQMEGYTMNMSNPCQEKLGTVNSRYSGHPRDRDLVSVIARVRNSGVRENFYFKPYLQKGVTCVFIFINSSTFFRPVVASKERQNFIYKQNRT